MRFACATRTFLRLGADTPDVERTPTGDVIVPLGSSGGPARSLMSTRIRFGRDADAVDVAFVDPTVSRQHCELIRRDDGAYDVRDLGSRHGTTVDGRRIDGQETARLDHLGLLCLGETKLRLLRDVRGDLDPATALPAGAGLRAALERVLRYATVEGRAVSLIGISLPGLEALGLERGRSVVDEIHLQLVEAVRNALPELQLVGHWPGLDLVLALDPETNVGARELAAEAVRGVSAPSEASARIVDLVPTPDEPSGLVLGRLTRLALPTPSTTDGSSLDPGMHRSDVLDARELLLHARSMPSPTTVVGVELEPALGALDSGLLDRTSREGVLESALERHRRLKRLVTDSLGPRDALGEHRERILLVALAPDAAHRADGWLARLRDRVAAADAPAIRMRTVRLQPRELGAAPPEALLDRLARRLLEQSAPDLPSTEAPWPFPMVGVTPLVESHASVADRAMTRLLAFSVALRFVVAAQFARIRVDPDPARLAELGAWLRESERSSTSRAHSFGTWVAHLHRLATLVPAEDQPIARVARAFADAHGRPTDLATELLEVVHRRNDIVHGRGGGRSFTDEDESAFARAWASFAGACRPLASYLLASVAMIEDFDEQDASIEYALRVHEGPSEVFPIRNVSLAHRLRRDATYLLPRDGGRPLGLAPHVFCRPCDVCGRTELFLAQSLVAGPPGAAVIAHGATTAHETTTSLAPSADAKRVYEAYVGTSAKGSGTRITDA